MNTRVPDPGSSAGGRRRALRAVWACVLVAVGTAPVHAQGLPDERPVDVIDRVIVHFRVPGVSLRDVFFSRRDGRLYRAFAAARGALAEDLRRRGVDVIRDYEHVPALVVDADPGVVERLSLDPRVLSIEPDRPEAPTVAESLPAIGADVTVANGFTGAGQVIAILDTDVNPGPSSTLGNAVLAEACFSTNDSGSGASSLCPGGASFAVGPGSAQFCPGGVAGCGHGTAVAAVAHAVAPDAGILAIKVFSIQEALFGGVNPFCAADGDATPCVRTYPSDQIAALELVLQVNESSPIAAVNMSLGGGQFGSECGGNMRALLMLTMRLVGIAPVVSAGNDGFSEALGKPACAPAAISVGSTQDGSLGTTLDAVSAFSNSAWFLDLLAPGEALFAAGLSGTSFAAPHVAGAWAVLRAIDPSASVAEILSILQSTGVAVTDAKNGRTTPRIQLDAAVVFMDGPRALIPPLLRGPLDRVRAPLPPWLGTPAARRLTPRR